MSAGGGMPSAPASAPSAPPPAAPTAPSGEATEDPLALPMEDYQEPEPEAPAAAPVGPGGAEGGGQPAQGFGSATPTVQALAGAAVQLTQVRDYIQQRAPAIQQQRQNLEQVLTTMLQGGSYEQLPPDMQPRALQLYYQWQGLA